MKIIKKAIEIGNGAAVYVPREYKGKEITLFLPEGIKEIKRRVLSKLIEFMPNILGVYLYGSYARNEQTEYSDVDLLIIVQEKDDKIKAIFDDIDIRVITLENIKKSIKNLPALILPILKEARVFLNSLLLEELKQEKIDFRKFIWNFQDIVRIIKIIEEFIKIDDKDISPSHIYSLMMRARILCMIEGLIKNKNFSNKIVKKTLLEHGLNEEIYEKYYSIYQKIRDNQDVEEKVTKEEILNLIKIIKKSLKKIKNETNKKA